MVRPTSRPAELVLPVASLTALRATLVTELGADTAARVLQRVGQSAGDALFELLAGRIQAAPGEAPAEDAVAATPGSAFWRAVADLFSARGWGTLSHEPVHPGVGALDATDWVEADPALGAARPSCHFTSGMLANLLGHAAGERVGVLEVECRSRGDLRCRFLFGGAAALNSVYQAILAGQDSQQSLAELT